MRYECVTQDMFAKYDNLDPDYIPVNTCWPKCNCKCPAAVLCTPAIARGDTYSLTFKLDEYIVENYETAEVTVDIYTFRGEHKLSLTSNISDSMLEFELTNEDYELLVPDVYYLTLKLHAEDEIYTLYNRDSPCLTIT